MSTIQRHVLAFILTLAFFPQGFARAQSAQTLIHNAATALGGMATLRALKSEVVEAEGKQLNSVFPLQFKPGGQISSFRYTLTRDLSQPRMKLEWEVRHLTRKEDIRFVEVVDGTIGLLQEGPGSAAKQSLLHPGRLATRVRDEKRSAAKLILAAAAHKSLRRLPDLEVDGVKNRVLSYRDGADEFHIYPDGDGKAPLH